MQQRWFLSQFYHDDSIDMLRPVCSAYGGQFLCPQHPATDDGWALVVMLCDLHQVEAGKQDNRVVVLPLVFDPQPLPQLVTDTYSAQGATEGMSLGALLAKLAETEPIYGTTL